LSKNKYNSFVSLLKDIKEKTSLNSRQLDILIRLNFFSDFGGNKYLLGVNEVYDKFANAKIIAKKKMEELGLSEYLMTKYSGKETASQYRNIDNNGLIKELCSQVKNESLGVVEQISSEIEFLGYANYTNKDISKDYYIVTNFDDSKNATRPYCTIYRICDGEKIDTRVNRSAIFKSNPFGLFSIINMPVTTYEYKKVKDGDKWVDSEEMRVVLAEYEVIK
jgi:DNA polymerase-3 subunit alpha